MQPTLQYSLGTASLCTLATSVILATAYKLQARYVKNVTEEHESRWKAFECQGNSEV
jgi:hypothetical protein